MDEIVSKVDKYFANPKLHIPYPNFFIDCHESEATPLLFDCLIPGDIPVLFEKEGKVYVAPKRVSASAINIHRIIRLCPLRLSIDSTTQFTINTIQDYLEVPEWMA